MHQATIDLILRMCLNIQHLCFLAKAFMIQAVFSSFHQAPGHVKMRCQLHGSSSTTKQGVGQDDTNDDGLLGTKESVLIPRAIQMVLAWRLRDHFFDKTVKRAASASTLWASTSTSFSMVDVFQAQQPLTKRRANILWSHEQPASWSRESASGPNQDLPGHPYSTFHCPANRPKHGASQESVPEAC